MNIFKFWTNLKLWQKVVLGMLLGIAFGHFSPDYALMMKPFGTLFINLIKMVVIPLVFFSILNGVASISDAATFGRIGSKAAISYGLTTMFAVIIGLSFANIFQPGIGVNIELDVDLSAVKDNSRTLGDIILGIVPPNPIAAMAEGNTVQVVMFSFFTGFCLILIGDKGRDVKNVILSATHLVFKMIELVIKLTPYGVFAIMAWIVSKYGLGLLFSLGKFVLVVVGALIAQFIVFALMLLFMAKLNPIYFFRKMLETQAVAFATISSKATLPTAMKELRMRVGVSKQASSFVLPLGAAMNMDGVAIYLGICVVFFAQLLGIELTWTQYGIIILTSTIGSIGAAGVPGGSMVMMGMVFSSVGLPLEGITIILGVDRFLEMLRTVTNITGDCTITVLVDAWEGTLNKKVYYSSDDDEEENSEEY